MMNDTMLVILDEYTGIHFFKILYDDNRKIKKLGYIYKVPIRRATHFNIVGNTLMVIVVV